MERPSSSSSSSTWQSRIMCVEVKVPPKGWNPFMNVTAWVDITRKCSSWVVFCDGSREFPWFLGGRPWCKMCRRLGLYMTPEDVSDLTNNNSLPGYPEALHPYRRIRTTELTYSEARDDKMGLTLIPRLMDFARKGYQRGTLIDVGFFHSTGVIDSGYPNDSVKTCLTPHVYLDAKHVEGKTHIMMMNLLTCSVRSFREGVEDNVEFFVHEGQTYPHLAKLAFMLRFTVVALIDEEDHNISDCRDIPADDIDMNTANGLPSRAVMMTMWPVANSG